MYKRYPSIYSQKQEAGFRGETVGQDEIHLTWRFDGHQYQFRAYGLRSTS